jgi:hypothetical protein
LSVVPNVSGALLPAAAPVFPPLELAQAVKAKAETPVRAMA